MALATNSTKGEIVLGGDFAGVDTLPELKPTGITSGNYTGAGVVVDAKGRLLFARDIDLIDVPCADGVTCGIAGIGDGLNDLGDGEVSISIASASVKGTVQLGTGFEAVGCSIQLDYPEATSSAVGLVIVPTSGNLVVDGSGNLSVPIASNSTLGVITVTTGNGLVLDGSGNLYFDPDNVDWTQYIATTSINGLIIVGGGDGLNIDGSGFLTFDDSTIDWSQYIATDSILGLVKVPNSIANGHLPNSTRFDGTNDYLSNPTFSSTDDRKMIFSAWIKKHADPSTNQYIFRLGDSFTGAIFLDTNNNFQVQFEDTAGVIKVNFGVADPIVVADGWQHIMFSFDLTLGASSLNVYYNDVAKSVSPAVFTDGVDLNFTEASYFASRNTGADKIDADFADVYIAFGQYLDLSVEANRRKFINQWGNPVNLGGSGALPTGTSPSVLLSNAFTSFQNNNGTAGNYTVNGSLTGGDTFDLNAESELQLANGTLTFHESAISWTPATTTTLGLVRVPSSGNLDISSGDISVPIATSSSLGVITEGADIDITSGVVSCISPTVSATTTSILGVAQAGTNIEVSTGVISVDTANGTSLGVVKQGNKTNINASGELNLDETVNSNEKNNWGRAQITQLLNYNYEGGGASGWTANGAFPDDSGDYLVSNNISGTINNPSSDSFIFSAWVNPSNFAEDQRIFTCMAIDGGAVYSAKTVEITLLTNGKIQVKGEQPVSGEPTVLDFTSSDTLTLSQENLVLIQFDRGGALDSDKVSVRINGVLDTSVTLTNTTGDRLFGGYPIITDTYRMYVGIDSGTRDNAFSGSISELFFYSYDSLDSNGDSSFNQWHIDDDCVRRNFIDDQHSSAVGGFLDGFRSDTSASTLGPVVYLKDKGNSFGTNYGWGDDFVLDFLAAGGTLTDHTITNTQHPQILDFVPDFGQSNSLKIRLVKNINITAPTNVNAGQLFEMIFEQDSTGSRTITLDSVYKFPNATAPTFSTTANAIDKLQMYYKSATEILCTGVTNYS